MVKLTDKQIGVLLQMWDGKAEFFGADIPVLRSLEKRGFVRVRRCTPVLDPVRRCNLSVYAANFLPLK